MQRYSATLFGLPGECTEAHVDTLLKNLCTETQGPPPSLVTQRLLSEDKGHVISEIIFESTAVPGCISNHQNVLKLEKALDLSLVVQPCKLRPRPVRLAVFDMDSTLIQQEVIDLLASHAGVEASVASITSRAMNGDLDFAQSLRERVRLLNGIPETVFEDLKPRLTFTPGAEQLLRCLRKLGVKTALLSGGFTPLATHIGRILGIDHVHANDLAVEDGFFTGHLAENCIIVDAERKRTLLESIASAEDITDRDQVMAIGDGANDLKMLSAAGIGIAVNAKPKVQEQAPCRLNCKSLVDVLYVLGFTTEQIHDLAS